MKRNKLKKVFSGIMTAALALTLCLGTAIPAFAADGTEANPAKATITKKFQHGSYYSRSHFYLCLYQSQ